MFRSLLKPKLVTGFVLVDEPLVDGPDIPIEAETETTADPGTQLPVYGAACGVGAYAGLVKHAL